MMAASDRLAPVHAQGAGARGMTGECPDGGWQPGGSCGAALPGALRGGVEVDGAGVFERRARVEGVVAELAASPRVPRLVAMRVCRTEVGREVGAAVGERDDVVG